MPTQAQGGLQPFGAWLREAEQEGEAKQFKETADITGIILTKLDGTAKGGIAIAIQAELGVPVKYIGIGEKIEDLQKFDSDSFVDALFQQ